MRLNSILGIIVVTLFTIPGLANDSAEVDLKKGIDLRSKEAQEALDSFRPSLEKGIALPNDDEWFKIPPINPPTKEAYQAAFNDRMNKIPFVRGTDGYWHKYWINDFNDPELPQQITPLSIIDQIYEEDPSKPGKPSLYPKWNRRWGCRNKPCAEESLSVASWVSVPSDILDSSGNTTRVPYFTFTPLESKYNSTFDMKRQREVNLGDVDSNSPELKNIPKDNLAAIRARTHRHYLAAAVHESTTYINPGCPDSLETRQGITPWEEDSSYFKINPGLGKSTADDYQAGGNSCAAHLYRAQVALKDPRVSSYSRPGCVRDANDENLGFLSANSHHPFFATTATVQVAKIKQSGFCIKSHGEFRFYGEKSQDFDQHFKNGQTAKIKIAVSMGGNRNKEMACSFKITKNPEKNKVDRASHQYKYFTCTTMQDSTDFKDVEGSAEQRFDKNGQTLSGLSYHGISGNSNYSWGKAVQHSCLAAYQSAIKNRASFVLDALRSKDKLEYIKKYQLEEVLRSAASACNASDGVEIQVPESIPAPVEAPEKPSITSA